MASTYTVAMENLTVVADATLVIIRAATAVTSRASTLEVLRVEVSQQGSSTSQQLGVILGLKASAFGTYVSSTPRKHYANGVISAIAGGTTNAASTCGVNASAEGAGTVTALFSAGFNNLNGYLWVPTPEERVIIPPDISWIVKLRGTPTTLTGWNASLTFREVG